MVLFVPIIIGAFIEHPNRCIEHSLNTPAEFDFSAGRFEEPAPTGNNDPKLYRINNSDIPFLHLLSVKSMTLSAYYLYVLDSNGIHSLCLETSQTDQISTESALKINFYDDELFILREGGLYRGTNRIISGSFVSFAIYQNNVYLTNGQNVTVANPNGTIVATRTLSGNIRQVTASSYGAFALVSLPQRQFAIYRIDIANPFRLNFRNLTTIPYAIYALDDALLVLTNNAVVRYALSFGEMVPNLTINIPFSIFQDRPVLTAIDNKVFFSNYLDNVYMIDLETGLINLSISSNSNADFFFNNPSGVSYRFGRIIVADTFNNRISFLRADTVQHFDISRPISAVVTHANELIAAYNNNHLINKDSGNSLEIRYNGYAVNIEKILSDRGFIYVFFRDLTMNRRTHVIRTTPLLDGFEFISGLINPLSIGNKIGGGAFVYDDGNIRSLKAGNTFERSSVSLIDFFMDYQSNIFGINTNGHFVFNSTVFEDLGTFSNISYVMSNGSGLAYFSDILLINNVTHSLFRLSSDLVLDITAFFNSPPPSANLDTARPQTPNAVTTTNTGTPLFSSSIEKNAIAHLTIDTQVFIRREIDSPPNMYFILAFLSDSQNNINLVCGFIYRAALRSPIPYTAPQNASGQVILANTHVFVFPSVVSRTYTSLRQGEFVRVLDFIEDTVTNQTWFRIAVNEYDEGFVLANRINTGFANLVGAAYGTNATLTHETMLMMYLGGERVVLETLSAGTRIRVVTPFDRSRQYTRVVVFFEGEEVEVTEAFVATRYVDFDGVDVWHIVLIVAIVFVVAVLILLAIFMAKRRRRVMPYGRYIEENDSAPYGTDNDY